MKHEFKVEIFVRSRKNDYWIQEDHYESSPEEVVIYLSKKYCQGKTPIGKIIMKAMQISEEVMNDFIEGKH